MRLARFGRLVVLTIGLVAGAIAQERSSFNAVDLDTAVPLDKLTAQLASKRVVFIGEIHDRYDHHLISLKSSDSFMNSTPTWPLESNISSSPSNNR
jgi:hypothetical protein